MKEKSLEFLRRRYRWYYFNRQNLLKLPYSYQEREFGFRSFDGLIKRHLSFNSQNDFYAYILQNVPRSIYYSVSLYEEPTFPMNEKGWKSADIPFDIDLKDIDHRCREVHDFWICTSCSLLGRLPTPETCPNCNGKLIEYYWICDDCLTKLREEVYKLYDLLENDLGIDRAKLKVHFSGNLGFHLIIEDTEFEELGQKERVELVDYIMLHGFRYSSFKYNSVYVPRERRWSYRIDEIIKRLGESDHKLTDLDVVKKLGIKIDASVTVDLHRIFRLPDSLHDDTGLAKKECTDLEKFDPFSEAVVFEDDVTSIFVYYSPPIKLKENFFGPFKKERVRVPAYVAVYLIAKGLADI